jgi:hypothetical protein
MLQTVPAMGQIFMTWILEEVIPTQPTVINYYGLFTIHIHYNEQEK